MLGRAIGFTTVSLASLPSTGGLGTGTILWSLGIPLASFLIGGLAAAMMAGVNHSSNGALHGVLVWGLGLLFIASLAAVLGPGAPTKASANLSEVYWLAFFSQCLAAIGGGFGGYLGSRPLHRVVFRERTEGELAPKIAR